MLDEETPNTPNGSKRANGYVHVAKLLKDFEKRHDNGKNILDESEKAEKKLLKQGENSETANDSDGKCACGKFRLPRVGRVTETFCDFYTNKKTSSNPADAKGDTELTAQTNDDVPSGAEVQQNSENANESEGNLLHVG